MKQLVIKAALIGISVCLVTACNPNSPNQNIGVATGAVAGGLLGSAVGAGTGQVVAIGAGAVAGALIGGAIGQSMDDNDRARMTGALDNGHRTYWVNSRTHRAYTVVPVQRVYLKGYKYCRRYYTIVMMNGHKQKMYGTACRTSGGAWVAMR